MNSFIPRLITLVGSMVAAHSVFAQDFAVDSVSLDGGGGTSHGGAYSVSGVLGPPDLDAISGGRFSLTGEFPGLTEVVAWTGSPITIFDNTPGGESGGFGATTNIFLAGKVCLGSQSYRLESLSLLLSSGNFGPAEQPPSSIRLRLYSHDPASGKPVDSTGLILNLSGRSNPVVLQPFDLIRWTPATSFTLAAGTCYWVVLSIDAGAVAGWTHSGVPPVGEAGTFGFTRSIDSGVTWVIPDDHANYKMLIQGVATQTPVAATLSVERQGEGIRVFWPLSAAGFVVDQSTSVTGRWSQVSVPYATNLSDIGITLAHPTESSFFRLRQP